MRVIFKVRDDLRQDQLVLNLLKMMDRCWKKDQSVGDLYITPYAVVPTWEEGGVVQVRHTMHCFDVARLCASKFVINVCVAGRAKLKNAGGNSRITWWTRRLLAKRDEHKES